jgi:DNA-binding transcriptional ArsR family regulator
VQAWLALADPIRREIVEMLADRERDAGELAAAFPVSRPAVSRHLRVLREAGLVRVRPEAQRRVYALDPRPLEDLAEWLERYRRFWGQRLDALDTELARGARQRSEGR